MARTAGTTNLSPVIVDAYETVSMAEVTRTPATVNPHLTVVGALAEAYRADPEAYAARADNARRFRVTDTDVITRKQHVAQALRLLRNAGAEHGVTVRTAVSEETDHTAITFAVTAKRERKATDK